jgi:transcriptional repressor NrdR
MYCPFCSFEETKVLESRVIDNSMRRRRECQKCNNRFTTYEKASFNLNVIKKDGNIQPFDQQKMSASIEKAWGKVDDKLIEKITKKIEQKILAEKTNKFKTSDIGKFILEELKKYDKMACLRFASVHKEINNFDLLKKELTSMRG